MLATHKTPRHIQTDIRIGVSPLRRQCPQTCRNNDYKSRQDAGKLFGGQNLVKNYYASNNQPKDLTPTMRQPRTIGTSPIKNNYKVLNRASPQKLLRTLTKNQADMKVQELKEWQTRKKLRNQHEITKNHKLVDQQCRDKPRLNKTSSMLFQGIKNKKQLSSDVLQRFSEYQIEKMQQTLEKFVARHVEETHSLPSLEKLYQFNKQEVELLFKVLEKQNYDIASTLSSFASRNA